jgi:diguanylate cyclase (GGDEF)-like protein
VSATTRSSRARRGRTLVVGDFPELGAITPQLPTSREFLIHVRNYFEALGEISIASAAAPIATVLLREDRDTTRITNAIAAMRKLDPSLRIVIACHGDALDATRWIGCGADDCVSSPIAAGELNRIFDEESLPPGITLGDLAKLSKQSDGRFIKTAQLAEPPAAPVSTDQGEPASQRGVVHEIPEEMPASQLPTSVPRPPATTASSTNTTSQTESPAPLSAAAVDPAPPAAPRQDESRVTDPSPASSASQHLGDIDLVEAVLAGGDQLRPTALMLIAQQTHWTDLSLLNPDEQFTTDQANRAAAAVEFADQRFGTLASAQASAAELQPWADWLARWLALDAAFADQRTKAMHDDLTGAGNRRFFDSFLRESIEIAARHRRPITLMVLDIDDFKKYNDQFGHEAGDEILRESVKLLQSVIRRGDRVCRIGGDEFAVIFADADPPREAGSRHPESIESIAKRFQDQICKMRFPKLGAEAPGTLTISAGLATFTWDGADPAALLRRADQLALESKRRGKNIITFGPGAQQVCARRGG